VHCLCNSVHRPITRSLHTVYVFSWLIQMSFNRVQCIYAHFKTITYVLQSFQCIEILYHLSLISFFLLFYFILFLRSSQTIKILWCYNYILWTMFNKQMPNCCARGACVISNCRGRRGPGSVAWMKGQLRNALNKHCYWSEGERESASFDVSAGAAPPAFLAHLTDIIDTVVQVLVK